MNVEIVKIFYIGVITMNKLKPCTCGSEEVYSSAYIGRTAKDDYFAIDCLVCDRKVKGSTLQETEEEWNRRADNGN